MAHRRTRVKKEEAVEDTPPEQREYTVFPATSDLDVQHHLATFLRGKVPNLDTYAQPLKLYPGNAEDDELVPELTPKQTDREQAEQEGMRVLSELSYEQRTARHRKRWRMFVDRHHKKRVTSWVLEDVHGDGRHVGKLSRADMKDYWAFVVERDGRVRAVPLVNEYAFHAPITRGYRTATDAEATAAKRERKLEQRWAAWGLEASDPVGAAIREDYGGETGSSEDLDFEDERSDDDDAVGEHHETRAQRGERALAARRAARRRHHRKRDSDDEYASSASSAELSSDSDSRARRDRKKKKKKGLTKDARMMSKELNNHDLFGTDSSSSESDSSDDDSSDDGEVDRAADMRFGKIKTEGASGSGSASGSTSGSASANGSGSGSGSRSAVVKKEPGAAAAASGRKRKRDGEDAGKGKGKGKGNGLAGGASSSAAAGSGGGEDKKGKKKRKKKRKVSQSSSMRVIEEDDIRLLLISRQHTMLFRDLLNYFKAQLRSDEQRARFTGFVKKLVSVAKNAKGENVATLRLEYRYKK